MNDMWSLSPMRQLTIPMNPKKELFSGCSVKTLEELTMAAPPLPILCAVTSNSIRSRLDGISAQHRDKTIAKVYLLIGLTRANVLQHSKHKPKCSLIRV